MASGKKGLGGGLSNLFGDTTVVDLKTETSADSVSKIAVSRIEPNPGQPRKVFAQETLDEGACFSLRDLAVGGHDMLALGLHGPQIGAVLQYLLELVIEGSIENEKNVLLRAAREWNQLK